MEQVLDYNIPDSSAHPSPKRFHPLLAGKHHGMGVLCPRRFHERPDTPRALHLPAKPMNYLPKRLDRLLAKDTTAHDA
jgi:hypothetical protein